MYMAPEESAALLRWLGAHLSTAVFVAYEQVQPAPKPISLKSTSHISVHLLVALAFLSSAPARSVHSID